MQPKPWWENITLKYAVEAIFNENTLWQKMLESSRCCFETGSK